MPQHSPRLDLEYLPSETLYDVARNHSAAHRALAARLLVEREEAIAAREARMKAMASAATLP